MNVIVKKNPAVLMLLGAALVSCATEDDRYRSTELLERPPTLIVDRKNESLSVEVSESTEAELGEKVILSEAEPLRMTIRQPFAQAWNSVAEALKQQKLTVTDRNREKGQFYVVYEPSGFLSKLLDFSGAGLNEANYILTLEDKGDETAVTATLIETDNSNVEPDGYYAPPEDNSKALLQALYDALQNDLKAD